MGRGARRGGLKGGSSPVPAPFHTLTKYTWYMVYSFDKLAHPSILLFILFKFFIINYDWFALKEISSGWLLKWSSVSELLGLQLLLLLLEGTYETDFLKLGLGFMDTPCLNEWIN